MFQYFLREKYLYFLILIHQSKFFVKNAQQILGSITELYENNNKLDILNKQLNQSTEEYIQKLNENITIQETLNQNKTKYIKELEITLRTQEKLHKQQLEQNNEKHQKEIEKLKTLVGKQEELKKFLIAVKTILSIKIQ
ncbi:hypothetical protein P344_02675 [Spiroplasma mirum ATCC 29335]|uniref:Uncharacterized protein n=1 Tax=Spiroplasma mirum ATCC 29335 TaxID=838561 RepID=W6AMD5_9MOLU|nr:MULTISPECIES: hypothetical protein [Spiroplasma]AHI57880.1 hypothetical protein P344_02675 [Spiroplasma mirum ATCC 29335]AKM52998.1 hypothetical protein SATRI_v1c05030 [Spiroplasma atrichopogonis]